MTIEDKLFKTAQKSPCKFRIAAAIMDSRGNIISMGYNKPRFRHRGGGIHAELDAIRKGGKNGDILVLMRIGRDNAIRPIEPCEACRRIMAKLGIKARIL